MPRFAHITRAKSGSQWVRDVLSDPEIIAAQGVRPVRPAAEDEMRAFAAEPDATFVAPLMFVSADEWLASKQADDRCVFVVRDPRDALVSWAFSLASSHVHTSKVALVRPAMLSLDLRGRLEIAAYVMCLRGPVTLSWMVLALTACEKIYRFEDVVADQFGTFRSMLDHFGWDVRDDVLRRVVDRYSFARRSGGRARGDSDPFSHFRNGVAGDWRNYLDRDLARRFEAALPGYTRRLGYESTDDWWMDRPETVPALGTSETMSDELERVRAELGVTRAAAQRLLERLAALEAVEHADR
jgi:hypothetical protein